MGIPVTGVASVGGVVTVAKVVPVGWVPMGSAVTCEGMKVSMGDDGMEVPVAEISMDGTVSVGVLDGGVFPVGRVAGVAVDGTVLAGMPVGDGEMLVAGVAPVGGDALVGVPIACEESATPVGRVAGMLVGSWLVDMGSLPPSVNTSKNASKP